MLLTCQPHTSFSLDGRPACFCLFQALVLRGHKLPKPMIWKLSPRGRTHSCLGEDQDHPQQTKRRKEGSGSGAQWGDLLPGSWREKQHQHQSCGLRGLGRWLYLCVYLCMGVCDRCMCVHTFCVIAVYVAV